MLQISATEINSTVQHHKTASSCRNTCKSDDEVSFSETLSFSECLLGVLDQRKILNENQCSKINSQGESINPETILKNLKEVQCEVIKEPLDMSPGRPLEMNADTVMMRNKASAKAQNYEGIEMTKQSDTQLIAENERGRLNAFVRSESIELSSKAYKPAADFDPKVTTGNISKNSISENVAVPSSKSALSHLFLSELSDSEMRETIIPPNFGENLQGLKQTRRLDHSNSIDSNVLMEGEVPEDAAKHRSQLKSDQESSKGLLIGDAPPKTYQAQALPDRIRPVEIPQQVTEHAKLIKEGETRVLKMTLHPETLGKIEIHIRLKDGIISGLVKVDSEAARTILQKQLVNLTTSLTEQRITSGNFETQLNITSGFEFGQSGREEQAFHQKNQRFPQEKFFRNRETDMTAEPGEVIAQLRIRNQLDLWA